MHITFGDQRTRDLCEKSQAASRCFGQTAAHVLRAFVSDVESVSCLSELPYQYTLDATGSGSLVLDNGLRVGFTFDDRGLSGGMSELRIDRLIKDE